MMPTPEPAAPELLPTAVCEEQRLWRAVLAQALKDAQSWRDQRFSQAITRPAGLDAWEMIHGNTPDFRRVCELAGIEAEVLREAFLLGRS